MKRLLYILLFLPLFANGQYYYGQKAAGGGGGLPTTGLFLDLDATKGITQSSNRVSAWADQSGNGHNFTEATSGLQPLWNGTNTVTFSGSRADIMRCSTTVAAPYTIYIIASVTITTNSDGTIFMFDDAFATNLYLYAYRSGGTNTFWCYGNNFSNSINNTTSIVNGTTYRFKAKINGASSSLSTNTATTTGNLGSATTISPLNIGYVGSNSTTMVIQRILIYTGTHDETGVDAYLTATYGKP